MELQTKAVGVQLYTQLLQVYKIGISHLSIFNFLPHFFC